MATFEDASRWIRVQFFLAVLGFCLLVGGLIVDQAVPGSVAQYIAFSVLAFVFYLLTLSLSFSWTFIDQARSNKGVYISSIISAILAAVFTIAHSARYISNGRVLYSQACLFFAAAIVCAILIAAFTIAEVAGDVKVTLPTLPSPRKAKKEKKDKDIEAGEEEKKDEVVELEDTPKEEKKEEETEAEKAEEGATNGHVVKEEEDKKEEAKEEEKKEEAEEKKDEEAAAAKE